MDKEPPNDLMCPICLDWLEEPIPLVCCGKVCCRACIVTCKQTSENCPCCMADITNYDAVNAKKIVPIAYLVEQGKKGELNIPSELFKPEEKKKG